MTTNEQDEWLAGYVSVPEGWTFTETENGVYMSKDCNRCGLYVPCERHTYPDSYYDSL
jgi:hypothetical protein